MHMVLMLSHIRSTTVQHMGRKLVREPVRELGSGRGRDAVREQGLERWRSERVSEVSGA